MITKKMCEEILDGSLTLHKKYLCGFHKGYYITIDYKPPVYVVYIHATYDNEAGKAMFESFLKQHRDSTQFLSKAEAKGHVIKLRIIEPKPKKLIPEAMNNILNPIITQLLGCKYETGCINCGTNDVKIDCYEISTYHHYLCEQCIREIEGDFIDKQTAIRAQTAKTVPGIIGALLGSILGIILWVILYNNNLYGWLAGIAIVFATLKGYEILGGRLDKKGFIISSVIIVIMMFLGNHLAWAWSALDRGRMAGFSDPEILLLWKLLIKENFVFNYCLDLILSFVFTLILGYPLIKKMYRACVGSYSIKKCE